MAYCKTLKLKDGSYAIVRLAGAPPAKCLWCGREHTKLCDFEISRLGAQKRTCDAPMCDEHAKHIRGRDRDLCPIHANQDPQHALDF